MREIKFRAWDKELNKMFTNEELQEINLKNGLKDLCLPVENKQMILMQYTGIKDDKEREIYEGDIVVVTKSFADVKPFKHRGEVVFEDGQYYIKYNLEDTKDIGFLEDGLFSAKTHWDRIIIIGNKFEVIKGVVK